MIIKEDEFLKYEKISFNQALILLNGELPTFDKYSDESFASIWKPRKSASEQIYKFRSEGNIELFELEARHYSEQIKAYNLLAAKYNDSSPTTPTINTQGFLMWAVSIKLLKEFKGTNKHNPSQNEKSARKQPNQKTEQQNKNRTIIQRTLLDFLEQSTRSKKYSVSELYQNSVFKKILKDNKIIITDTGEDANKSDSDRKPNEMTPRTLGEHLTAIFKCISSNWWTEQDKETRDKVKKY